MQHVSIPAESPSLPAEPVFPAPLGADDLVFALFFFSLLASVWPSVGVGGLDLGCADDLVAFASTVFLGVDLGVGFGVAFGVAFGFAVAFGTGVSIGVVFGNSISLFA
jgi:hypothetical protein